MARDGLAALAKASSGIFYQPYLGGFNMQFRSIGQSVPNRWVCIPLSSNVACPAGGGGRNAAGWSWRRHTAGRSGWHVVGSKRHSETAARAVVR